MTTKIVIYFFIAFAFLASLTLAYITFQVSRLIRNTRKLHGEIEAEKLAAKEQKEAIELARKKAMTVADSLPPPPPPPANETPQERADRERAERLKREEAARR